MREYLEKKYEPGLSDDEAVKLAVETLLEVVENDKNMEVCVVRAR